MASLLYLVPLRACLMSKIDMLVIDMLRLTIKTAHLTLFPKDRAVHKELLHMKQQDHVTQKWTRCVELQQLEEMDLSGQLMLAYKVLLDKQKLYKCVHGPQDTMTVQIQKLQSTSDSVEEAVEPPATSQTCPSAVCRCETLREVLDQLHEVVALINDIVSSIESEHQRYLHSWSYLSGPQDIPLIQKLVQAAPLLDQRLKRVFDCQQWVSFIVKQQIISQTSS